MPAARCTTCNVDAIQLPDKTWVIKHDTFCPEASDYQPQVDELVSLRDIVVPYTLDRFESLVEDTLQKVIKAGTDHGLTRPEVHLVTYFPPGDGDEHWQDKWVEMRGIVTDFNVNPDDGPMMYAALATQDLRVMVYKDAGEAEPQPDISTGIDVTCLFSHNMSSVSMVEFYLHREYTRVSKVHHPSPLAPIVKAS